MDIDSFEIVPRVRWSALPTSGGKAEEAEEGDSASRPRQRSLARSFSESCLLNSERKRHSRPEDQDGFFIHRSKSMNRKRTIQALPVHPEDKEPELEDGDWLSRFKRKLLESDSHENEQPQRLIACTCQPGIGPAGPCECANLIQNQETNNCRTPVLSKLRTDPNTMFPLFRPAAQRKVIHIIRHGESEYNAACNSTRSWDEILIFDPHLTDKGRMQARNLKRQLVTMNLNNTLWVVSPLTRAIETFLLACPDAPLLKAAARGEEVLGDPPEVVLCPLISEHLMTAGDIGRPRTALAMEFPEISSAVLSMKADTWWYSPEHNPNSAESASFNVTEPKAKLLERVDAFRKWVMTRKENTIVAIGHSMFWRQLLGNGKILKNCELYSTRM